MIPHTRQQNDMFERKSITLVNMVHCLVQAKDMSTKFWDEVVYCDDYLFILVLTHVVSSMTLV